MSTPSRVSLATLLLLLLRPGCAGAQAPAPVEDLLAKIAANTARYVAAVPSLSSEESILSQQFKNGALKQQTEAVASFRVLRTGDAADPLSESRTVTSIGSKPVPGGSDPRLPVMFLGGFGKALTLFFSPEHRPCLDFRFDPVADVLSFNGRPGNAANPACAGLDAEVKGLARVDPDTGSITHLERSVPTSVARRSGAAEFAAVDYRPVDLNGTSFLLPSQITASTTRGGGQSFLFIARYSNFHRYTATSTILPVESH